MKISLLTLSLLLASIVLADESRPPVKPVELQLVASPSFEEPLDASFAVIQGTWTAAGGVLTGSELPDDKHAAVLHHKVGLRTAVIECEFRLSGSPQFLVGCDGKGLVGRVVVKATGVDIAEDSAKPSKVIATLKTPVALEQWHHLRVEWKADEMIATLDDQTVSAKHPFFATAKSRSWLAVPKAKTEIRKLAIRGEKIEPLRWARIYSIFRVGAALW